MRPGLLGRPAREFIAIKPVEVHGSLPGTPTTDHGKRTHVATIVAVDVPHRRARTAEGHDVSFDNVWVRDLDLLFRATPLDPEGT